MICKLRNLLACLLTAALCVVLFGCASQKPNDPVVTTPSQSDGSILSTTGRNDIPAVEYTPVYASAFGDTVLLATVPVEEWNGEEPSCPAREISNGGRIRCNGEHEQEEPITQVLILEDLIPRVCSGWFRDMVKLETITGLEKLHTHAVTDMSYMFYGCQSLTDPDFSQWDVSKVEDMTAMFEGCATMTTLPDWYPPS